MILKRNFIPKLLLVLLMSAIGAVIVFPFYIMTIMSTHPTLAIHRGLQFLPGDYLLTNIDTLLRIDFLGYYRNSLFVSTMAGILSVYCSAMGGYALAVYDFKGKKLIMAIVLVTLTLPFQIALIGIVIQANFMGLADTHWILILLAIPSAFGVFWMSSFARQAMPQSVIESAHIDGANAFTTFSKIGLPLLLPACGTLFLLVFLAQWNSFLLPVILLARESMFTLPIAIRLLANNFRVDVGAQITGVVLGVLPIMLIFASFSKTLIQGLSASAVKE